MSESASSSSSGSSNGTGASLFSSKSSLAAAALATGALLGSAAVLGVQAVLRRGRQPGTAGSAADAEAAAAAAGSVTTGPDNSIMSTLSESTGSQAPPAAVAAAVSAFASRASACGGESRSRKLFVDARKHFSGHSHDSQHTRSGQSLWRTIYNSLRVSHRAIALKRKQVAEGRVFEGESPSQAQVAERKEPHDDEAVQESSDDEFDMDDELPAAPIASTWCTVYTIETYGEFLCLLEGLDLSKVCLEGWVCSAVDFSEFPLARWRQLCLAGSCFFGCTFPKGSSAAAVRRRGAEVLANLPGLPFRQYRAFGYTQQELQAVDTEIYNLYLKMEQERDLQVLMAQSTHDLSVHNALISYLRDKTCVVIMGGHGLKRAAPEYSRVVWLSRRLARQGYIVLTGGGPGAMEAANLGAYMWKHSDKDVQEAIRLLQVDNDKYEHEYQNKAAAQGVIDRFGWPTNQPSLGVPTWRYGHEPPNMFAAYQFKMFSNAVREDGIIYSGSGGIIYTPGSAGTRQEVFQDACRNHYAPPGAECPMVFLDSAFWDQNGVFDTISRNSKDRAFHEWLLLADEDDEILRWLNRHRETKGLPVVSEESLTAPWWMDKQCHHEVKHF